MVLQTDHLARQPSLNLQMDV